MRKVPNLYTTNNSKYKPVKVGYDSEGKYIRDVVRQIRNSDIWVKVSNQHKFSLVEYLFNELEQVLIFKYISNEDGTYTVYAE